MLVGWLLIRLEISLWRVDTPFSNTHPTEQRAPSPPDLGTRLAYALMATGIFSSRMERERIPKASAQFSSLGPMGKRAPSSLASALSEWPLIVRVICLFLRVIPFSNSNPKGQRARSFPDLVI